MKKHIIINIIILSVLTVKGQISGRVYLDKDGDGKFISTKEEFGLSNVEVKLFDPSNNSKILAKIQTSKDGQYSLHPKGKLDKDKEYRVEFAFPVEYATAEFGVNSALPMYKIAKNGDSQVDFILTPLRK